MAYTQLEEIGPIGLRELLNFPNIDTPIFYPIFLFVIFFVITSMSYFRELQRESKGNLLSSLAVGGFVTMAMAVGLTMLGLIQVTIMVVVIVIFLVFGVIYLLTGRGP